MKARLLGLAVLALSGVPAMAATPTVAELQADYAAIGAGPFSACRACHTNADSGNYNEREVRTAGFGRWDD